MAIYQVTGVGEHGKYFDEYSYKDTIGYILGHAVYAGCGGIRNLSTAAEEMRENAERWGKNSRKRVRHSVLSFGRWERVTAETAAIFAQDIIRFYSDTYQIVFAVHNNTDRLHIHFVMSQVSLDGQRYRGQKKDYHDFLKWIYCQTGLTIIPVKG